MLVVGVWGRGICHSPKGGVPPGKVATLIHRADFYINSFAPVQNAKGVFEPALTLEIDFKEAIL